MTNEVEICNKALGWLGQESITSLNEQSTTGELCKVNYPTLRDAVISERMWTFATVREVSESVAMDTWDQQYVHDFPDTWLQVFRVYSDVSTFGKRIQSEGWSVESGHVLANEDKVYLWGVNRVTASARFSPLFVECLAARLAADLAIPVAESRTLQADMWALYNEKLAVAAVRDGQQGRAERMDSTRLTNARAR